MNCLLCDLPLPQIPSWRGLFLNELPQTICIGCRKGFEMIEGGVCRYCSRAGLDMCEECVQWEKTAYAGCITSGKCLFTYNKAMQDYIYQFKFLQDVVLARAFAPELHEVLKRRKGAAVVPIPVHPERLKNRTFAQVEALLHEARIPFLTLLEKTEAVQGQKSREQRLAAERLFSWNGQPVPKRIVLVDDLYTTGTTMRHAAKVLKDAGAESVDLLSLVRS